MSPHCGLACPITGSRPVKSLCHHDHGAQLVVPSVDLARSPRWRADGRESSRDVSRRARAPPLGCAAAVAARRGRTQRGRVGRCAAAASIGAPAVPRRRRGDDSAGSQSRRGPVGTRGGRGGACEAIAAPSAAIAIKNSIEGDAPWRHRSAPRRCPGGDAGTIRRGRIRGGVPRGRSGDVGGHGKRWRHH